MEKSYGDNIVTEVRTQIIFKMIFYSMGNEDVINTHRSATSKEIQIQRIVTNVQSLGESRPRKIALISVWKILEIATSSLNLIFMRLVSNFAYVLFDISMPITPSFAIIHLVSVCTGNVWIGYFEQYPYSVLFSA